MVSRYCNKCGAALSEDARFCDRCGQPVTAGSVSSDSFDSPRKSSRTWVIVVVVLALLGMCCLLLLAAGLLTPSILRSIDIDLPQFDSFVVETPQVILPTPMIEPSAVLPEPTQAIIPTLSVPTEPQQPTGEPEGVRFSFENVQFFYDPAIVGSMSGEVMQAQTNPDGFPGSTYPRHIQINLKGYADENAFLDPYILIYPLADYIQMEPQVIETSATLDTLLVTRETNLESMPFLPYWNAGQVFNSNVAYLDFQNGSGVRYLSQYAQDVSPINNQYLFYTFQGLTADRKYYIAAVLPVNHPMLPDEYNLSGDDYQKFSDNYLPYLAETKKSLSDMPNDSFEPDLSLLDALFESLSVE